MPNQKTLTFYQPPKLTQTEANALMVMLDSEMEATFEFDGLNLDDWENLDLAAYKIKAYHVFKTWYEETFGDG